MISYQIQINQTSAVPKYRQIANSIIMGIKCQRIGYQDRLPSINEVSMQYEVSRDTVEKAYKVLKKEGLILSVPGKGYFAADAGLNHDRKLLLVFNKLSAYKKIIFDSFMHYFQEKGSVDLLVYHDDYQLFEKIMKERAGQYTDYIIIPSFLGEEELHAKRLLQKMIPANKLFLASSFLDGLDNIGGAVYQNYEKDIYQALIQATPLLQKYEALYLTFPSCTNYSRGIVKGFQKYCLENNFPSNIIFKNFEKEILNRNVAYLVINDDDLVTLVKKIKSLKWRPQKDIGVLAYNDSPLKEILLDGITVVSTDHQKMGEQIADLILNPTGQVLENPFELIIRNSL